MKYTLDAKNQSLGRIATQAATLLMGKNDPSFARNTLSSNTVEIINASKIKTTPKKMLEKTYVRYSGYPGGLKTATMEKVTESKGYGEVVARAIKGMLPDNRLRKGMLKQLTISE